MSIYIKPASNPEEEKAVSNFENASRILKNNLKAGQGGGVEQNYTVTYRRLYLLGLATKLKRKYRS